MPCGPELPNGPNACYQLKKWNEKEKTIAVPAGQIAKWKDFAQVEMIVRMMWAEAILRLDSFTTTGDVAQVVVQNPERDMVFLRPYPMKLLDQSYHFENAYEFLDACGEWYLDTQAQRLYYLPRQGEDMTKAEVIVPVAESLLRIEGTLENPVHNVRFRGMTFEHTNWTKASQSGMLDMQAGMYNTESRAQQQAVVRPATGGRLCGCGQPGHIRSRYLSPPRRGRN